MEISQRSPFVDMPSLQLLFPGKLPLNPVEAIFPSAKNYLNQIDDSFLTQSLLRKTILSSRTPIIAPLAKRPYQPYQADSPLKIDVFGREASGLFNQSAFTEISQVRSQEKLRSPDSIGSYNELQYGLSSPEMSSPHRYPFLSSPEMSSPDLPGSAATSPVSSLNIRITSVQGFQQPATKIHYCTKCGYGTAWESALRSHMKLIHEKHNFYECLVCRFKTKRKRVLKAHMKSHKGVLTYRCSHYFLMKNQGRQEPCHFTTRVKNLFHLHQQGHVSRNVARTLRIKACDKCSYQSSSKAMMRRHQDIYHDRPVPSELLAPQNQELLEKYLSLLKYKAMPYKCPACPYVTCSKKRMTDHSGKHSLPTQCPFCPYSCIYKTKMLLHMRQHREKSKSNAGNLTGAMYKCNFCNYETRHKNALRTHIHVHTHDRPYRCHICNYSAIQKVHLDAHMYKHFGILPYKCTLCKYTTATKASLKAHMCRHTGIKPFKCEYCDYRSARKADLKKHIAIRHKEMVQC